MMRHLTSALLGLMAAPAIAQTPGLVGARLIAGEMTGETRLAALEIVLEPGWKTYWRLPGESGVPPQFDWSGSVNLAAVDELWPAPEISRDYGMTSFVYHDRLLLPLRLTPEDAGAPLSLRLTGMIGVCDEICVAAPLDITAEFPAGAQARAAEISAALDLQPQSARALGLRAADCAVVGAGAERRFTAALRFDAAPGFEAAAAEGPEGVWLGPVAISRDGAALTLSADLLLDDPEAWLARDALDLTLIGPGGAWEVTGCAAPG